LKKGEINMAKKEERFEFLREILKPSHYMSIFIEI